MQNDFLTHFISRWHFVRSETLAILSSLEDEQLAFRPAGEKWQPLYYQFACIGRTQLVYAMAVQAGRMDFSLFGSKELPRKVDFQTNSAISHFLAETDNKWLSIIQDKGSESTVVWPDDIKPLALHMTSLMEHERMHHGQLISYFTLADIELPPSFKDNWAL